MFEISRSEMEPVIRLAEEYHAKWPQYKDHWRGEEWKPVRILRNVRTKSGLAFTEGERTIGRQAEGVPEHDIPPYVVGYSTANHIDTALPQGAFEWGEWAPEGPRTVGRFTLTEDGALLGPAEYMAEQGNAKLDRILAGEDPVFNMTAHLSPSIEVAVLVAMQTDFAGWKGTRDFMASFEKGKR